MILLLQWRRKQDYYVRRQKIHMLTHTGAGWSARTLTIIWSSFLTLWTSRNEAIHGHNLSSQQQARKHQLCIKMEILHTKRDQVLACDTDAFLGDTPAELNLFLDSSSASHVQNWLHVWKPFILLSVNSARDLSLQGIQTLQKCFTPTNKVPHRPLSARAHCTARPRIRQRAALPQPLFQFWLLRSFFGTHSRQNPTVL
jgi:hypothetical protein